MVFFGVIGSRYTFLKMEIVPTTYMQRAIYMYIKLIKSEDISNATTHQCPKSTSICVKFFGGSKISALFLEVREVFRKNIQHITFISKYLSNVIDQFADSWSIFSICRERI